MKSPEWISHRGLAKGVSENTLQAFRKAHALKFDRIETDLQLSKDGQLVLCHDPSFSRLSSSAELVSELNAEDIAKINLSDGGSPAFLSELVGELPNMPLTLDIKLSENSRTVIALIKYLKDGKAETKIEQGFYRFLFWSAQDQSLFLKTFPQAICYARSKQCYLAGVSSLVGLGALLKTQKKLTYSLPFSFLGMHLFKEEVVARYHKSGSRILAFLPENEAQAKLAIEAGFDEILTNHEPVRL